MAKKTRRQLTLFVDPNEAENIEAIRRKYDPVQSRLIKSHVTLCGEDEIEDLDQVMTNLRGLQQTNISIAFGPPIRFDEGKGVLIPAKKGDDSYQSLREQMLKGITAQPRNHEAHITLLHPRNATCTDIVFDEIQKTSLPESLVFKKISLIEQEEGNEWRIIREFE